MSSGTRQYLKSSAVDLSTYCRTIGDLGYDPQGSDHPSSDPPGRW